MVFQRERLDKKYSQEEIDMIYITPPKRLDYIPALLSLRKASSIKKKVRKIITMQIVC